MDTNELVCLGMTCLVLAVLLEKVLSHVIVNQFALSISERTEEEEILLKRAMQEESLERLDLSSSSSSSHSRDENVAGACETLTAVPHARGGESQIPPESLVSTQKNQIDCAINLCFYLSRSYLALRHVTLAPAGARGPFMQGFRDAPGGLEFA